MIHSPEPFRVYSPGVANAVIQGIKRRKRRASGGGMGTGLGVGLYDQAATVGAGPSFNGQFASLFPGAYQVVQTDLGLTYGGTFLAGGGSTDVVTMTGTLAGTPVPILAKGTGPGTVNIYYDGGTTPAMSGLTPVAGTPIALTGAGNGLSLTWGTIAGIALNNTWTATCAGLADQSGNGKHYSQATASKQPVITVGLNGKVGLLFDGVDDQFDSSLTLPAPGTTPAFAFAVFRQVTWIINSRFLCGAAGAASMAVRAGGATPQIGSTNGGSGNVSSGATVNAWVRAECLFNNSTTDYLKLGSSSVTGTNNGNTAGVARSIGGAAFFGNYEILAVVWAPYLPANRSGIDSAINSAPGYGIGAVLV